MNLKAAREFRTYSTNKKKGTGQLILSQVFKTQMHIKS